MVKQTFMIQTLYFPQKFANMESYFTFSTHGYLSIAVWNIYSWKIEVWNCLLWFSKGSVLAWVISRHVARLTQF